ncbi:SURF1 family protein [Aliikangiella maris]|uniref:SURF1 family protein n=2 Tax=Aliikangiella maris TaxID=3162458 RepID=A0ABV2BXQ0_9GAMM
MKHSVEYSIGRYQLRINIWFLIIFLLVQTLLNELGFWQLNRAKEKQQRLVLLAQGEQETVTSLSELTAQQINQFQKVKLKMQLKSEKILFLDNQVKEKRVGYHVLNVAQDSLTGKNYLLNRGWVMADIDRSKLPDIELPDSNWLIEGRVYPLPPKSISTESARVEVYPSGYRLPVLDQHIVNEIGQYLGLEIQYYIIRLDQNVQGAFDTEWVWTNMTAEKHLAYAFQWFSLALGFLVVSLFACINKR